MMIEIDDAGRRDVAGLGSCMIEEYLQPIAQHADHPERLLLRGADGRWYVWTGERPAALPAEIAPATAAWMLVQPGLRLLPGPLIWLHPSDLPTLPLDAFGTSGDPAVEDATAE
jgi:hypothetical protein